MPESRAGYVAELLEKDFVVEAEIGSGGVGFVFRAFDREKQRPVAIKVLGPGHTLKASTRERFIREAKIGTTLHHPGIVRVYKTGVHDELAYYSMRLVEGESLAERLTWDPVLPIDETRAFLAGIADALECAHQAGVIHRDVKPGNIMIDAATGRPLVTDFGLARTLDGGSAITRTGDAVGTPAYMSPEQALGERDIDARSDVYSLGVLAYRMIAGETPFSAKTIPSMLAKHVHEAPRPLRALRPEVPDALAQVIERALAKGREDRWQSAAAFRDALGDVSEIPMTAFLRTRPASVPAEDMEAGRAIAAQRTLERRVARFRQGARVSGWLVVLAAVVMLTGAPGSRPVLVLACIGVGYAVYQMVDLLTDDVSFARLFRSAQHHRPETPSDIPTLVAGAPRKDFEPDEGMAAREAAMDLHSIELVLARLTPDERARIPDLGRVARGIYEELQRLTAALAGVETALLGAVAGGAERATSGAPQASADDVERRELVERRAQLLARIEDASAGLLMLRMDLISLEAKRLEGGMESMLASVERARGRTTESN